MKTIVGLFNKYTQANQAVLQLEQAGFNRDQMHIVAQEYIIREHEDALSEGVAAGATIGGIAGLIMGLTAIAIPGIGPIIATAGILSSTAVGAGVGAAFGGVVGALVDLGMTQEEASAYVEAIKAGSVLVMVKTRSNAERMSASAILQRAGAVDVQDKQQVRTAVH
ncbi:MAG: hypothetical protein HYZ63_01600 [Candidatus Andersenbacteria bacterium]|nr:hypothetical protein [Candidatus Andersenbacteria bacterium]